MLEGDLLLIKLNLELLKEAVEYCLKRKRLLEYLLEVK